MPGITPNEHVGHGSPRNAQATAATRQRALTWMPATSFARRKQRFYLGTQFASAVAAGLAGVFAAYVMLFSWPKSLGQVRESSFDVVSVFVALMQLPFVPELRPFLPLALMSGLAFPAIFQWFRLLTPQSGHIAPFGNVWTLLKAVGSATLLLYLLYTPQLTGPFAGGRHYAVAYFIYFAATAFFTALLLRAGVLSFIYFLRSRGVGHTRVAVIAKKDFADVRAVMDRPDSEHTLVGAITVDESARDLVRILGPLGELANIINRHKVDEILLAADPGDLTVEQRTNIAETCWKLGVELKMITPFHPYFRTTARTEVIGDFTVLRVEPSGLYTTRSQVLKRLLDIILSLTALILLAPLMALVALLIKVTSPGPVLFVQERPGLHGRVFRILKFRTMRTGAETGIHQEAQRKLIQEGSPAGFDAGGKPIYGKVANDPRVTPLGKLFRSTSIDELPQLWNVLRGEMSLVGPRPAVLADVENFKDWHFQRHDIRPGLTGLWQVSGRSRLSFDQMVALDITYIEEWSIWLDVKILMKTLPALFQTDQAF
ncbi:MAG: sugar transferase [Candidatus Hydrogenedentes bacterium]|nr:sugar transferase [Candidatus Hydrogenedentota bacterium]